MSDAEYQRRLRELLRQLTAAVEFTMQQRDGAGRYTAPSTVTPAEVRKAYKPDREAVGRQLLLRAIFDRRKK